MLHGRLRPSGQLASRSSCDETPYVRATSRSKWGTVLAVRPASYGNYADQVVVFVGRNAFSTM